MLKGKLPICHKWFHATIHIPIANYIQQEIGHVRHVRLPSIPPSEIIQRKLTLRGPGFD